jgi:hypothetical protein
MIERGHYFSTYYYLKYIQKSKFEQKQKDQMLNDFKIMMDKGNLAAIVSYGKALQKGIN